MVWEELQIETSEENLPKARAGHSAVAIHSRIYIWSGRDGYRKAWNNQICFKDLWFLEVEKPAQMSRMQLISSSTDFLELSWTKIPCVEYFILQIQLCPSGMDKSYSFDDIPHFSPSPVPIPNRVKPQPMSMYHNTSMPSCHNFNRYLPTKTKEVKPICSPKYSLTSQSMKYNNFHPSTNRPFNTTTYQNNFSNKPYSSPHSQVSFNYSSVRRNGHPSFNISQSSELPNSSQVEPLAVSKPAQTLISLSPKKQTSTTHSPIIITIPPVFKDEQQLKKQTTVSASPKTVSFMSPVMSKPNISKSYTTNSITKTIPTHIPVACAPVAPRSAMSSSQTASERSASSSCKSENHFPSDSLTYKSSAMSQLEGNKATVITDTPVNFNTAETVTDSSSQSAPDVSQLVKVAATQPTAVQFVKSAVFQPQTTRPTVINTSGSSRPITFITTSQLSKTLSSKPYRLIQKMPNQSKPCILVQKPIVLAKENVPSSTGVNQSSQPKPPMFKLLNSSQGTTALLPGTRLITIKRPLTIKMPGLVKTVPATTPAVVETMTSSQLMSPNELETQSESASLAHLPSSADASNTESPQLQTCQPDEPLNNSIDSSQSVINTECSLESKDLKRPLEEFADGDSENSSVEEKKMKLN